MEIEKKYLVEKLPDSLERYKKVRFRQGYISTHPVLRLRSFADEFIFTFKNGCGIEREEFESNLTRGQFSQLWKLITGKVIVKDRYYIPIANRLVAELDVFQEHLYGLITVEVEFISVEQAESFIPPKWFGKDISMDKNYYNSTLSKN